MDDGAKLGAGLQAMTALMEADVAAARGPSGRHDPERTAVRHGRERGSVTLGGRRVGAERPRMRAADGAGEVPVPAYELFSSSEILGRMAMGKMLGGLSNRRYPVELEPVGEKVERAASGTSMSALGELLAVPLGNLDLVALMIDGVHSSERLRVVALEIVSTGSSIPWAWSRGSTENTTVMTDLLTDLRACGLDTTRPIVVGIDGGKALCIVKAFDHPVIQGCEMHKLRDVADKLPDDLAATVMKKMREAYHATSAIIAEAQLEALARELEHTHPARQAGYAKAWPRR
jgi:putative transposase